jgi:Fe-S cluster assembly protein SufD
MLLHGAVGSCARVAEAFPMPSIAEPVDFQPTASTLAAALDELEDVGASGGGAVGTATRRAALAAYARFGPDVPPVPAGWRHRYGALPFRELEWSTGRLRVPALPPVSTRGSDDQPALAVANAAGLVHLASTYLEPQGRTGDPRVTVVALADAKRRNAARVDAVHGKLAPFAADRFVALATAFQNCGAYVEVPDGVVLDAPIQLVWTTRPGATSAVFPHTVVRVGAGAHAIVYERHLGAGESFVAGIVEADLGPNARLDYVVVQDADDGARILMHRAARCAAGATVGWHVADLGGALARSTIDVDLAGAGAACEANLLFFARGFQNADIGLIARHTASHTRSRTIVRSAATERGRGRFQGDIRIASGVAAADAVLREAGLLLSRDAALEVTPALEIASNHVSAYHSATIGSLDEEHLFYVQSRGISRRTAERMMALAFCEPAIAGFPGDALRDEVRTLLDARLEDVPETFAS